MMKIKTIKKAIAMFSLVAVSVCTFGLNAAVATGPDDPETVVTTLNGSSGGCGDEDRPFVKAKWEMLPERLWYNVDVYANENLQLQYLYSYTALDDDPDEAGAQFNAPGVWGADMNYKVCAIVTDPNGPDDVADVYADIFWPENRPMHASMDPSEIDDPSTGCGDKIEENTLVKLSKEEGIELFCNKVRVDNHNLPAFGDYMTGTDDEKYDEICNSEYGELPEEEAFVYCDEKTLTWEDPAGFYTVEVTGHDLYGPGAALENEFEYVEFTGFEIDFSSVAYQNVLKDVRSQVSGDRNFDPTSSDMPTVRNIGNTRLNVLVAQDDMGFEQRDYTNWNVAYDARVGNDAADWSGYYDPFKKVDELGNPVSADYTTLYEVLDLSEVEKMDFVVLVEKWTYGTDHNYTGTMWLDAERAEFDELRCTR